MAKVTTRRTSAKGFKPVASNPPTKTVTTTTPFDYAKYFANEPTLQAEIQRINAAGLTQRSQLVGGEQQLFGRLGEAPDLSLPQFANLSPELRKALEDAITPELQGIIGQSNQAGTSALARLNYGYRQAQGSAIDQLAAQGVLRSSQLGYLSNQNLRGLTLGQYDVRQQALDALGGLQNTFLSGQQDLAGQTATALSAAQERAGQLINAGLLGPTTQTRTVTNPYLNPAAPKQISTPVKVGSTTSYEPKPTAPNYIPAAPSAPKPAAPKAAPYKPPSLGFRALR